MNDTIVVNEIKSVKIQEKDVERFWEKVEKGLDDECWAWRAGGQTTYGAFWVDGKTIGAHQFSFMIHNNVDVMYKKDIEVNHICDNMNCVNPHHLILGNARLNARDRQQKGRGALQYGANNPVSQLSWGSVLSIRKEFDESNRKWGLQTRLAEKYNVSTEVICTLLKNQRYDETKVSFQVNEIFGKTVQGEGPSVGRLCSFIRFSNCSLACFWCDSDYSWRFTNKHPHRRDIVYKRENEIRVMKYSEILEELIPIQSPLLIITGGEPMLQARNLGYFCYKTMNDLEELQSIEIETAGIIFDEELASYNFVNFNVSPKLENSGNSKKVRYIPDVLDKFNKCQRAIFKFVASTQEDFNEIEWIINEINIPKWKVYIMAEGEKTEDQIEKMKWVAPMAIEKGYNFTPRLHTLIWGTRRGV